MAPDVATFDSRHQSESATLNVNSKPTVYCLNTFVPAAIEEARRHFNVVLPSDSDHANWRQAKYLLIRSSYLTADDVASCPNLLAIGKQGVGMDKIDTAACAQRGVKVFNTPGVNARAVAELVLALTAALAWEIGPVSMRMAGGGVVRKETCSGLMLYGCTIEILGMGNIGRIVAKIFKGGFECKIVAYDPYMGADDWSDIEHERVKTVEDVLRVSDVVTIHIPLTKETKDLISYRELV